MGLTRETRLTMTREDLLTIAYMTADRGPSAPLVELGDPDAGEGLRVVLHTSHLEIAVYVEGASTVVRIPIEKLLGELAALHAASAH